MTTAVARGDCLWWYGISKFGVVEFWWGEGTAVIVRRLSMSLQLEFKASEKY